MSRKTVFFTHTSVAYALYILGNAVIIMPVKTANEYTFLGYLVAVALAFILLFALTPLLNKIFMADVNTRSSPKRILSALIYFITALFALWCAADTFQSFTNFAHKIMLPKAPVFFAITIFLLVVLYFAFHRQESVLKFCILAFWLVLVVVIFFFIACIARYNLRNIFVFKLPNIKELVQQTTPYIINPVIPAIILPVYNALVFKKASFAPIFTGLATGFSVLGLCTIGSVLLFGAEFAGLLEFPYASAVSTVTVGRLFTRLDEFSYFVYFVTSLIKITLCIFVFYTCLKKTNTAFKGENKNEKTNQQKIQ